MSCGAAGPRPRSSLASVASRSSPSRSPVHELLLSELRAADLLDFYHAAVDSSHIRAMKGGPATGPSPVDRGKAGSEHHLIVEAHGIPLAASPQAPTATTSPN